MTSTPGTLGRPSSGPVGPETGDDLLVGRAAAGDAEAFGELHRRHQQRVTAVVVAQMRRGRDAPDREDVVQEVFATAWLRLGDLRDPARFRPWLLQIARRTVIDHARWHRHRPVLDGDDDLALARVGDAVAGPQELAEARELALRLRRALGSLQPREATVITLVAQRGLGSAELAAALDTTSGNAKVVLHRARLRLRALADVG